MLLKEESDEAILQRLKSRVPNDLDKREGGFISDTLAPVSIELAQQKSMNLYFMSQAFASKAEGEYLEIAAQEVGVEVDENESEETLRARVLQAKRNPERGGGDSDYEKWAYKVAGVRWARTVNKARGLGTVDVIISGDADRLDELVEIVQEEIEDKMPTGIDLKVKKVNVLSTTFRIKVMELDPETARQVAIDYINSVGVGGIVVLSQMQALLIFAGAKDTRVLEPIDNIVLPIDSIIDPVVIIE